MTGITSGIGLISGINTASLIDQLLAVEARPKFLAIDRMITLQNEQAAFLGINSLLLTLGSSAGLFNQQDIFDTKTATSSNSSVLSASASTSAPTGSYQFLVNQLVSSHQMLSSGFADSDQSAMGMEDISFEFGNGSLASNASLASLNGGTGVQRGTIRVTDSDGNATEIDLTTAVTMDDVLTAINDNTTIDVTATLSGDGIVLTDNAGGVGTMEVEQIGDETTAADLGILGTATGGVITGTQINSLFESMGLAEFNDGNGVFIGSGTDEVSFTLEGTVGGPFNIVLGEKTVVDEDNEPAVTTIQGVIDRINEATGGAIVASLGDDGVSLKLTDTTGSGGITVGEGLLGETKTITDLGFTVGTGTGSETAGRRVIAGLNSVLARSLNGGNGFNGGTQITITDRNSGVDTFTLDEDASLSDIVDQINASGSVSVTASLNDAGNGLKITDTSGGTGNLDVSGDAAAALGIEGNVAENVIEGSNLQLQYVSESSRLEDLNYGRGIGTGSFKITDGRGVSMTVNIDKDAETLDDVISEISSLANTLGVEVTARINDNGDGLIIEDTSTTPVAAMKIETVTGTTARDLNIVGEGDSEDLVNGNFVDGSYEKTIDLDVTDTLDEIVNKVNSAGIEVSATIINNGSGPNPYHLSFSSKLSGTNGEMIVDTGGVDLGLSTLVEAEDAVVFFGSEDPTKAVLLTSSTNSLDGVINGVSIDLLSTSSSAVTVTITEDNTTIVNSVQAMVDAFNGVMNQINAVDSYNDETEQTGILLGNPTVARLKSSLLRTVQGEPIGVSGSFSRFSEIGINIGNGGTLEFDADRFREALNEDPEAVKNLFAAKDVSTSEDEEIEDGITIPGGDLIYDSLGIAEQLKLLSDEFTNSVDGTLTLTKQSYDSLIDLQEKRITRFDEQLESKRARLEAEFAAMELALANLQQQSQALSSLVVV